jgi:hypothetical protein
MSFFDEHLLAVVQQPVVFAEARPSRVQLRMRESRPAHSPLNQEWRASRGDPP